MKKCVECQCVLGFIAPQTSSTGAQQQIASPEAAPTFPNGTPTMPPPLCVAHPTIRGGDFHPSRVHWTTNGQAPARSRPGPISLVCLLLPKPEHIPHRARAAARRSIGTGRRNETDAGDTSVRPGAVETNGTRGVAPPASWPANCRGSNKPTNLLYYTVRGTRRGSDSAIQPYLVSAISILPCSGRLLERGCRVLCGSRVPGSSSLKTSRLTQHTISLDQIPQMEPPPSGPNVWE